MEGGGVCEEFKGERRRKKFRIKTKVLEKMDIRKYFKKLEEKLAVDNPALSLNCPERSKKQMEPLTDLWQGGEKTENKKIREKFETKSTLKRSRTSLREEEKEHYQCRGKKRRKTKN